MSKYTQIANSLKEINEGNFQTICNLYLAKVYGGEVKSPGSVVGKEKTRKGRPDSYIRFDDDSYLLAEFTTKEKEDSESAFLEKLTNDLKGCMDAEELGIETSQIREIILCCNSPVDIEEEEKLKTIAAPYRLKVTDIHSLSIFFATSGKLIARDYLGVRFGTNQLLSKEQFLNQYHKRNLSTPLNTVIIGRDTDTEQILNALVKNDLVILKGAAGNGKSRLALEVIDKFIANDPIYQPFYVLPKNDSISEDLIYNLEEGGFYLLFIDDANRQLDNFIKILTKQIEAKPKTLKIILTVRDYAFEDIKPHLGKIQISLFEIGRVSDDQMREILVKNNYIIEDIILFNRIIDIAHGNPRLALMAASFTKERPNLNLLLDASTIYDEYFQSIIQDKEVFKEPAVLKVLGILSYFYAIDLETNEAKDILRNFGLNEESFFHTTNLLHELEIVDIYDTYTVRISEQVLSTYFFYKTFIKERLLSFDLLVNLYFEGYSLRMKDSIYPAVNSFGRANTIDRLKEGLMTIYENQKINDQFKNSFLSIFGIYLPTVVFIEVQRSISQLPSRDELKNVHPGFYSLAFYPDLKYLEVFYGSTDRFELRTSIDLTLQYLDKRPGFYDAILKSLSDKLFFTDEDLPSFERQRIAFEFLIEKHVDAAKRFYFPCFSRVLLSSYFPKEAFYKTGKEWRLHGAVRELREKFWQLIISSYKSDGELCKQILLDYLEKLQHTQIQLVKLDSVFIKELIETQFQSQTFFEAYFVQGYLQRAKEMRMAENWFADAKRQYNTSTYKLLTSLTFNRNERMIQKEIRMSHEEFLEYKFEKIRKNVPIRTFYEFKKIYPQLNEIINLSLSPKVQINPEVSILIGGIISIAPDEGIKILKYYFKQGSDYVLNMAVIFGRAKKAGVKWINRIYKIVKENRFPQYADWQEYYFAILPEQYRNKDVVNELLEFYSTTSIKVRWVDFILKNYLIVDEDLALTIMRILVNRKEKEADLNYDLGFNFFSNHSVVLEKDFELSKRCYFQLITRDKTYDYDKKEFALFFKKEQNFLIEYLQYLNIVKDGLSQYNVSGFENIWAMGNAENSVYDGLIFISSNKNIYSDNHAGLIFFQNINELYKPAAIKVLKRMIESNFSNLDVINLVLDIGRNSLPDKYHELILYYLSLNTDIEMFKELRFYNSHFMSSGRTSWDEFKAGVLKEIREAITRMPNIYLYLEHLNYLDKLIVSHVKRSEEDRKRWFMGML